MGYDPAVIVREVSEILARKPGRSLHSITKELGVDRHTVTRSVKRHAGMTFHELQANAMRDALSRLRQGHRPLLR
jgi:methylphosphotriester-DNA--protein-cysteine methyltransferase